MSHPLRRQRGTVLTIALIVLVAMILAGAALWRSADPDLRSANQPQQQRAALQNIDAATHDAMLAFLTRHTDATVNVRDPDHDQPAVHYYASAQALNDHGIPIELTAAPAPAWRGDGPVATGWIGEQIDDGAQQLSRYVIERLCSRSGAADGQNCRLSSPPSGADCQTTRAVPCPAPSDLSLPYLRISVRIDGPQHKVVYGQLLTRAGWRGSASLRIVTPPG